MRTLTITLADDDDVTNFKLCAEKARAQDGTLSPLWRGLLCSALKRATVPAADEHAALLAVAEAANSVKDRVEDSENDDFECHAYDEVKALRVALARLATLRQTTK